MAWLPVNERAQALVFKYPRKGQFYFPLFGLNFGWPHERQRRPIAPGTDWWPAKGAEPLGDWDRVGDWLPIDWVWMVCLAMALGFGRLAKQQAQGSEKPTALV
jgi:hypothetical protein